MSLKGAFINLQQVLMKAVLQTGTKLGTLTKLGIRGCVILDSPGKHTCMAKRNGMGVQPAQIQLVAFEGCAEQTNFPSDCCYWALMCCLFVETRIYYSPGCPHTYNPPSKPPLSCNYNQTYTPTTPNLDPELCFTLNTRVILFPYEKYLDAIFK